jgi:hypothetical protein
LPLTRGHGLWLVFPILVAWVFKGVERRSLAAATLGYAAGVALYLAFYAWRYGDPFAGIAAQEHFVSKSALANLVDLPRFVVFMVEAPERFLWPTNSGLDKLMIVLSLVALAWGVRRSPDPFIATTWTCFAVLPALMGEGASYARYALLAWACFAIAVGPTLTPAVKWAIIVPGFAAQFALAWIFGSYRWVA